MTGRMRRKAIAAGVLLALAASAPAPAQDSASVTLAKDTVGTPAERAALVLAQMTQAEKMTLLEGYFGTGRGSFAAPAEVLKDPLLDPAEKRAILSSWASDASAVEGRPTLRWLLGTPAPVPLTEVLAALSRLDGPVLA